MKKILLAAAAALVSLVTYAGGPLIGISSGHSSKGSVSVGDSYVEAVTKAGGVPVVIPLVTSEEMAADVVAALDGVLMTGGEDVNPLTYGEEILNETVKVNEVRDTSDIRIIRAAVAAGKPILAICRGSQVTNVALGGTLIQDIPSQVNTCLLHKQTEPGSVTTQVLTVEPGSYFSRIMSGATTFAINTLHHEAVKVPAKGLKVTGRAADGVVEVMEGLPELDIVTVQFHPEKLIQAGDMTFMPLFEDFIRRASAR